MIYAAVFLLSLASLAYEVLLPRIFAFTQWHHLAFLVISVAVFGFGAGGAAVSLAETRRGGLASRLADPARAAGLGRCWCLLFCLSAAGSLLFLLAVPLDYFRLPVEARQAGYLALTWLLLLLPFLLAGAVQALAFAALPGRSGWLYAAGMAGGACGALLPMAPPGSVGGSASGPGLPGPAGAALDPAPAAEARVRRRSACLLACAALAVAAAPLCGGRRPPRLRPSPYKLLAQARQLAGTRHLGTENGLSGRVDWLDSPALRFVPGLSLAFPGGLPQPEQAVIDGDALLQLFPLGPPGWPSAASPPPMPPMRCGRIGPRAGRCCCWSPGAWPCRARSRPAQARSPWWCASRRWPGACGSCEPGLRVITGNPRSFLASSGESYDLVQLESWGPSAPGAASLDQDHLLTTEALAACLRRLQPGRPVHGFPAHPAAPVGLPAPAGRGLRGPAQPGGAGTGPEHRHAAQLGHLHPDRGPAARSARMQLAAAAPVSARSAASTCSSWRASRKSGGQPFRPLRSAVPLPGAPAPRPRAGGRAGRQATTAATSWTCARPRTRNPSRTAS